MILLGIDNLSRREQARELLAWGAERYWGLTPLPELEAGERGKPWFPSCPQNHFNLSHSGSFALCALSDQPVGVDIQEMRAAWRPSLVERTCSPEERAWLASLGDRGVGLCPAVGFEGERRQADGLRSALPAQPSGGAPAPTGGTLRSRDDLYAGGDQIPGLSGEKIGGERPVAWRLRPRKSSG